MNVDLETAAVRAANVSGFDFGYWRMMIAEAEVLRGVEIDGASDADWLSRRSSGWIINLALARLGETLDPTLAGELFYRVETIRMAHNAADAKWLTTPDQVEHCWRTLHAVQQLVAEFAPKPRRR